MDTIFVLTPPPESDPARGGAYGPLEMQQIESRLELEEAGAVAAQKLPQECMHGGDERLFIVGTQVERPRTPEVTKSLNTRVDTLEISFDVLMKRVDGLRRMLDDMRTEVHGMEGKLDELEEGFGGRLPLAVSPR